MNRPIKTVMFDPQGNVWGYDVNPIPGAFRIVSVEALLGAPRSLKLYELNDLDWSDTERTATPGQSWPKYAAISHVWKFSEAVLEVCEKEPERIEISTIESVDGGEKQRIDWRGLVDAARAARRVHCEYLWLDLLCIDQVDRTPTKEEAGDKKKQIEKMGKIYERAGAVLVMVGGVGAVQGVDETSAWIDRAWTLQEASLCENTYVLVNWPFERKFKAPRLFRDDPNNPHEDTLYGVEFFEVTPGEKLSLIRLENLLELELVRPSIKLPDNFDVRCFESGLRRVQGATRTKLNAARLALLAVLRAGKTGNEELKQCGAWRCMLLRISERPEDMIFSIMHLLGVKIEVNHRRSLEALYAELVMEVAARGCPAWLGVGSSNGDIIPRNRQSGLCPEIPKYEGRNLPVYRIGGSTLPVSGVVSRSADYIANFDIKFMNQFVCCRMLQLRMNSLYTMEETEGSVDIYHSLLSDSDSHLEGTCWYRWNPDVVRHVTTGIYVVIIGQTGLFGRHHLTVRDSGHSRWYVYLVQKIGAAWTRVGAGIWIVTRGCIPNRRTHMIFGERNESPWSTCNCDTNSTIEESNERDVLFDPIDHNIGSNAYKAQIQRKLVEVEERFERIKRTMEEMRKVVAEGELGLVESRRNGDQPSDVPDESRFGRYYSRMGHTSDNAASPNWLISQSSEFGKCEACHPRKRRM